MQMSSIEFFAFVEGVNVDGFVHGMNCDRALAAMHVSYRVSPADQLPGDGGGKTRLSSYFEFLKENSALANEFKGKKTVVAFFMDKDLDDRIGRSIASDHVLYTDFYDVENHVFHEGDVARAVAAACSLPPNWCREEFGDKGSWQELAARLWCDWVRLCYASQMLGVSKESNYGRPSPLNPVPHGPSDEIITAQFEAKSHAAARKATGGSCNSWHMRRNDVNTAYDTGRWDEVFKGKWYGPILASHILARSPNRVDKMHLAASLVKQVAATMNFDSPWAISTQGRLKKLASSHGLGSGH
ncbi:hypothetical protein [Kitasatospora sp. NPDC001527]|uniref:hypothetical protein n=1 Tax=Kitasatospora sp. NPDC001527 TaxID=3154519 RepID=UPI00332FEEA7